jgi:hypothetical protein
MTRLLPLLLVAFLALTGCRESLTAPLLDVDPITDEPTQTFGSLYVKVSGPLTPGGTGQLRAEDRRDAVSYQWGFQGTGDLASTSIDHTERDRILSIQGLQSGFVSATATAYDADGAIIGVGSRMVEITAD